jgi:hypothetical protein
VAARTANRRLVMCSSCARPPVAPSPLPGSCWCVADVRVADEPLLHCLGLVWACGVWVGGGIRSSQGVNRPTKRISRPIDRELCVQIEPFVDRQGQVNHQSILARSIQFNSTQPSRPPANATSDRLHQSIDRSTDRSDRGVGRVMGLLSALLAWCVPWIDTRTRARAFGLCHGYF